MAVFDVILGDTHCVFDLDKGKAFLRLTGNWAGLNAHKLSRFFGRAVSGLKDGLVLNLEGCRNLDSQALGALIRLRVQVEALGQKVTLVGVPNTLQTIFEGAGLIPTDNSTLLSATSSAVLELR